MDKYPEKSKTDKTIDSFHVGAQIIPFGIGSAITEFIKAFYPNGFEARKEQWLLCLAEKVSEMPTEVMDQITNFFEKEEGKTLLLKATIAVITTHKLEKYIAIRNVLLNTAIDPDVHYDQKEIYLGIITTLEPYDMGLLNIFKDYCVEFEKINSFEDAFLICKNHSFKGSRDEFFLMITNLKDKSLIRISEHIEGFGDVYSADVIVASSTDEMPKIKITDFAKSFISYVEDTTT